MEPSGRSRKELRSLFEKFALQASAFSREVYPTPASPYGSKESVDLNLRITKAIFGKWAPEIVVALYTTKKMGFEELRKTLRPISRRVLSLKLKKLEAMGFVRREVLSARPPRVEYSLTDDGLLTARLAEPFFLFLRSGSEKRESSG
ncbi:MAG: helix-turn-helix transcriptional regulator [Nitrososphaerales archaeon]|nr:helix-turn-helix transcriptional regulator [Nitrososphaerales archaeon]